MAPHREANDYSPRQWAALAIMVAMAMVLSFVEFALFPTSPWLKYDPSSIIAILAALLYGPGMGCAVAVLAWVPRLVTDPLGAFMNIMSVLPVIIVTGAFYRRRLTRKAAIESAIIGSVCAVVVSVALNIPVMPLFYGVSVESVLALLGPVLIPFNIIKVVVNSTVALLTYSSLEKLLSQEDEVPAVDADAAAEQHDVRTRAGGAR